MRILVVLPEKVSLIIACEPAVESLRNRFKSAEIILMTTEANSDILSCWEFADDILIYDSVKNFLAKVSFISLLRKQDFENIYYLGGALPDLMQRFLLNAENIIVPDYTLGTIRESQVDCFIQNDIDYIDRIPEWHFPSGFRYPIGQVKAPLLTIMPFSSGFPLERYVYIVSEYNRRFGGSVVITGDVRHYEKSMSFDHFDFVFNQVGKTDHHALAFIYKYSTAILVSDRNKAVIARSVNADTIYIEENRTNNPFDFLKNHWPASDDEILKKLSEITDNKLKHCR